MERRALTSEEVDIVTKQVVKTQEDMPYFEYIIEHSDLMINKGLKLNYEKQLKEYKAKRQEAVNGLNELKGIIEILNDQLQNGVMMKEKTEEVKAEVQ